MKLQSPRILITLLILSPLCRSSYAADRPLIAITIRGPLTIAVGDQIPIHSVLKNVSNHRIQIWLGATYTVVIHDENGKELSRKPWLTEGSSGPTSIEPGDTAADFGTDLKGLSILSRPGRYVVQFTRPLDYADLNSPIVESNEITISVILPKKGTVDSNP
jgi:hypothetical protein